jgi:Protein of unknown function (DUF1688)
MNLATDLSPAQRVAYLQTLPAIRERCGRVYQLAELGKLEHFDYHPEKESDVVDFCIEIIQVGSIHTLLTVEMTHPLFPARFRHQLHFRKRSGPIYTTDFLLNYSTIGTVDPAS